MSNFGGSFVVKQKVADGICQLSENVVCMCHPHLGSGMLWQFLCVAIQTLCPEAEKKSFMSKMTHLMMMKTLNWKGDEHLKLIGARMS